VFIPIEKYTSSSIQKYTILINKKGQYCALIKEMKKADRTVLLSCDDGKKEFESIKKRVRK